MKAWVQGRISREMGGNGDRESRERERFVTIEKNRIGGWKVSASGMWLRAVNVCSVFCNEVWVVL